VQGGATSPFHAQASGKGDEDIANPIQFPNHATSGQPDCLSKPVQQSFRGSLHLDPKAAPSWASKPKWIVHALDAEPSNNLCSNPAEMMTELDETLVYLSNPPFGATITSSDGLYTPTSDGSIRPVKLSGY